MANQRSRAPLFSFGARLASPTGRRPRRPRMLVEALEARLLLHGGGTLDEEHAAVMRLIDFETINRVAGGQYWLAKPGNNVGTTTEPTYLWRDPANWWLRTWVPGTGTQQGSWAQTQAQTIPGTGADAYIPTGLTLTYDIGPSAFPRPLLTGGPGPLISVRNDLRLHSVGVAGGLLFPPSGSELFYVDTMVVRPGGSLTITESNPANSTRIVIAEPDWTRFSLANPFDREIDPFEFTRGIISHGTTRIAGESVTPFVTLPQLTRAANNLPPPGSNLPSPGFQFTLPAGTTGWTVGDRIVVAGTSASAVNPSTGASSDEEAVIIAITPSSDGTQVVTAKVQAGRVDPTTGYVTLRDLGGLQADHVQPTDPGTVPNSTPVPYTNADGSRMFGIQVANLSRNVVFQSENPYHTMARGHVMFMHNADVQVAGAGFYGLGRSDKRTVVDDVQLYTRELIDALNQAGAGTPGYVPLTYDLIGKFVPGTGLNPRGRYSVHFHRAGINETDDTNPDRPLLTTTTPASVRGSVVVDSPGWGFVNHTSYVNFDDNIAFNVVGASFVTEAGNELGRFVGNLAMKGVGTNTGEGIESRKQKQDFGFQGDGFWFQGPAVRVENNIAVSQRHDGFVFFTEEMRQKYTWVSDDTTTPPTLTTAVKGARLTTDMLAAVGYSQALITALGGPGKTVDPGNVPILGFTNNTATAVGVGFETWFHQLGATYDRSLGSQIVGLKVANTRGTGSFNPYTNKMTVRDSTLIGNPRSPGGTGMDRNSVTANITYDNVTVRGFNVGVQVPVNDTNVILGGRFQNKINFNITTANSVTRLVQFSDKTDPAGTIVSPLTFLAIPNTNVEPNRINVNLTTSYDPKDRDISKMFHPDIIRMGTVWINSFAITGGVNKQLYYFQQRADFRPFPRTNEQGQTINYGGPVYDRFGNLVDYDGIEVPPELLDLTNQQLMTGFGLAIGGTVAPADAVNGMGTYTYTPPGGTPTQASPRINGLIGAPSTYQLALNATSARYTQAVTTGPNVVGTPAASYVFSYRVASAPPATGTQNVTVKVGNFIAASGFPIQITTLGVNGTTVYTPANMPPPPTIPPNATPSQIATIMRNYYNTTLKLPLREGWNLVSGNLDGTGATRTQLIYGDLIRPDLNATTPDAHALRRLTTNAATTPGGVWAPGLWDGSSKQMSGLWVGTNGTTPMTATVTGQFVAVMNPLDLSIGFQLKGRSVDNSFGDRGFDVTITGLSRYLDPNGAVPFLTPVTYVGANTNDPSPYGNIMNYETFRGLLTTPPGGTPPAPVFVRQHLQTMFFAVKDLAGNTKTFALTIFLDPTAPRTGGTSNPSGTFTPSASMIALGDLFVIDEETLRIINGTR